jgi:hypothetical protein
MGTIAQTNTVSSKRVQRAASSTQAASTSHLLGLWGVLRIFTGVWLLLVSAYVPFTPREWHIPVWPPSSPMLGWLERVTLAPWDRWDVSFYLRIAERGYRIDDGTAQFHPLLPWLAAPLVALGASPLLGVMLVSSVASAALVVAFARLARLDVDADAAHWSTLLVVSSPFALALWAPYTEPLFLLCATTSLLWARRGWWWRASLAAAFAVLTRQQGIFLALPLAVELWVATDKHWRGMLGAWRHWLSLALVPAALLLWLVYRAVALGDFAPDWSNPQTMIYSILISPSAAQVVPNQAFLPPWHALWLAVEQWWRTGEWTTLVDLGFGAVFVVLLAWAWPRMRWSYRVYALVITGVSFGYHTGPFYPYMGLPRHLLLAFPVFVGLGAQVRGRAQRMIVLGMSFLALLFTLVLYGTESWTP